MNNPYDYMEEYKGQTLDYKEFCELMNEPELKKKQKTTQLNNLSNYMNLIQSYGKITIESIYDADELLIIKHSSKFTEYISDLLILYLNDDNTHKITLTYSEMEKIFCMANENYFKAKNDNNKYNWTQDLKLPTSLMGYSQEDADKDINKGFYLFFNEADKIMKQIINNSLKSLKSQSLIIYKDNFKLYKLEQYMNEDGEKKNRVKTIICNKKQREELLDIRNKLMVDFKIEKMQDIIFMTKQDRDLFYNELCFRMSQSEILEYSTRYANAFDIEYGEKAISYKAKRIVEQNKKLVNSNMEYKMLTTQELKSISDFLKKQLVDKFI